MQETKQLTIEQLQDRRYVAYTQQKQLTRELIELDIEIAKRIKYNSWPAANRR